MPDCPLCQYDHVEMFYQNTTRVYLLCQRCQLVFVPEQFHLSGYEEKKRYDYHCNSADDAGYRDFLNRLFAPLRKKLAVGASGLDYGCGPGPALARMFEEAGHTMKLYDLHYAPDQRTLQQHYDFICCSEAIEHFARPAHEWQRFLEITRPGSWIGIMTQMRDNVRHFADWYYKNDPTHIGFYSRATFQWLARQYRLSTEYHDDSVVLFRRLPG